MECDVHMHCAVRGRLLRLLNHVHASCPPTTRGCTSSAVDMEWSRVLPSVLWYSTEWCMKNAEDEVIIHSYCKGMPQ